jgi:hypothetical protein
MGLVGPCDMLISYLAERGESIDFLQCYTDTRGRCRVAYQIQHRYVE